jgi:hypothetical protein
VEFKEYLEQQLGFLRRSCDSYDAGHTDEAIRIATTIRVLIHNTKSSTSLLKHLGALDIKLSSTVIGDHHSNSVMFMGMGRLSIVVGGSTTWKAATVPDAIKTQLPVSDWWNQVVYILGKTRASRKDLILAAANKDGGAHIDANLTTEYESLMTTGQRGFFHYTPTNDMHNFQPVMDAHLVYLRQMGFEILSSPQLLAFAVQ